MGYIAIPDTKEHIHMARHHVVIDDAIDAELREFTETYQVPMKRIIEAGIPLAMAAYKAKVTAAAKAVTKSPRNGKVPH